MQRALTLVATSAALSLFGVDASPYASAFRRRDVAQIPGYDFAGCYTEATGMRALTGTAYFDDLMTVEKCAAACEGFKHFGIEYGRECYCGNTINDGSVEADLADCSFACPGDSTQNCGAGDRLDMYTRTTDPEPLTDLGYASRGCYVEPAGGRALASTMTRADNMTVEQCATFCGNAGFRLFGLEYYTECYCGNVLMPGAEPAAETDCRFPCTGNPSQLCGGDWRINLYEFGLEASSTSTSAAPTSTPSASPVNYSSEGCYTEATGVRALSDVAFYDDAMTVEKCAAVCAGYTWFGLEYGRECYCGNTINSDQGSVATDISECSFPCPGNPSQKCGAGDRLNMYRNAPPAESSSVVSVVETTSAAPTSISVPAVETSTSEAVVEPSSSTTVEPSSTETVETSSTETVEPSSTETVEPSTSSTTGPETLTTSTTTAEPTTTSTSTTSTAEPTTTTSSPATPTNAITNGDFESDGGWTIRTNTPALTYNLADTSAASSGLCSASISFIRGFSGQAWFSQVITLKPNTQYNFSGMARASSANPGCHMYFYIGTADSTAVLKIMAQMLSGQLKPQWASATGTFTTAGSTAAEYTFNVRLVCPVVNARTYFVDDVVLVEA